MKRKPISMTGLFLRLCFIVALVVLVSVMFWKGVRHPEATQEATQESTQAPTEMFSGTQSGAGIFLYRVFSVRTVSCPS